MYILLFIRNIIFACLLLSQSLLQHSQWRRSYRKTSRSSPIERRRPPRRSSRSRTAPLPRRTRPRRSRDAAKGSGALHRCSSSLRYCANSENRVFSHFLFIKFLSQQARSFALRHLIQRDAGFVLQHEARRQCQVEEFEVRATAAQLLQRDRVLLAHGQQ